MMEQLNIFTHGQKVETPAAPPAPKVKKPRCSHCRRAAKSILSVLTLETCPVCPVVTCTDCKGYHAKHCGSPALFSCTLCLCLVHEGETIEDEKYCEGCAEEVRQNMEDADADCYQSGLSAGDQF